MSIIPKVCLSGFAIKKIGADFFVFYKDSLNNKEIDGSFKKLINEKYSEQ